MNTDTLFGERVKARDLNGANGGRVVEYTIERAGIEDAQEVLTLQRLAYGSEDALYHDITIPPVFRPWRKQ